MGSAGHQRHSEAATKSSSLPDRDGNYGAMHDKAFFLAIDVMTHMTACDIAKLQARPRKLKPRKWLPLVEPNQAWSNVVVSLKSGIPETDSPSLDLALQGQNSR